MKKKKEWWKEEVKMEILKTHLKIKKILDPVLIMPNTKNVEHFLKN